MRLLPKFTAAASLLCLANCGSYHRGYWDTTAAVAQTLQTYGYNLPVGTVIPVNGNDADKFSGRPNYGAPQTTITISPPYREGNKLCVQTNTVMFGVCIIPQ